MKTRDIPYSDTFDISEVWMAVGGLEEEYKRNSNLPNQCLLLKVLNVNIMESNMFEDYIEEKTKEFSI